MNWNRIASFLFAKPSRVKMVKVCPHCGSTKIKLPPAGMDLKMTMRDYCQNCKFRGNFATVEECKLEDFRKRINK